MKASPFFTFDWSKYNVLKSGNVRIIIRHKELSENFASYCTSLLFQLISKSRSSTSLAASVLFNCAGYNKIFEDLYKHLCFCYYYLHIENGYRLYIIFVLYFRPTYRYLQYIFSHPFYTYLYIVHLLTYHSIMKGENCFLDCFIM